MTEHETSAEPVLSGGSDTAAGPAGTPVAEGSVGTGTAPDEQAAPDGATGPDTEPTDDLLVLDSWQVALPATGDDRVDAALSRLADVDGLPPSEHADVYEAVHADLHAALADLDQA